MNRLQALEGIARRHGVALVYLFGSQADVARRHLEGGPVEPADPLADIDVGVVFLDPAAIGETGRRLETYAALHAELSDLLPPGRLDLVFLQETNSVLQARAIAGHCVYAVSEAFKDAYEHRVLARAADFLPVLERYYAERLRGWDG